MKIELEKFKAFSNECKIDIKDKNLVVYGENGAGKSSIYEALKVIFFKDRLRQQIESANTQEEQEINERNFWCKYNHQNAGNFTLKINDVDYLDFDSEHYQVFMLSLAELQQDNSLQLDALLERYFFDITDINGFCNTNYFKLEENVNNSLASFNENIVITIDKEDNFRIKITDSQRNIEKKSEIRRFFNEAKLNLLVLLLVFHSIKLSQQGNKEKLLILDDFITSLDVANRTYILKFIFDNFSEFRLIIFTHNITFYNLIIFFVNNEPRLNKKFIFANLYEINNINRIYYKDHIKSVKDIKKEYQNINDTDISQLESIGNKIRQKFEILLYELSKLLMIGAVEDSKKIIQRIENGKSIYLQNTKNVYDLVDEIVRVLSENNPNNLSTRLDYNPNHLFTELDNKIEEYKKQDGFQNLQEIIRNLKVYQKVTLHPMSHGTSYGNHSFTTKEIETSLVLLEKLERSLKGLVNSDVSTQ